jgi:hypothetical protein
VTAVATGTAQADRLNADVAGLAADEIAHAAQRIEDAATDAPTYGYLLREDQARVFRDFAALLTDVATRPTREAEDAFGRIVLPPRTGKTVIAGHIIARSGLRSTFAVGVYFGERRSSRPAQDGRRDASVASEGLAGREDPGARRRHGGLRRFRRPREGVRPRRLHAHEARRARGADRSRRRAWKGHG